MSVRKTFAVAGAGLLATALVWRSPSRQWQLPCPYRVAHLLDYALTQPFSGAQTTVHSIGIHPGQRVLEVGPGAGRLTVAAARRPGPAGELVCVDIEPAPDDLFTDHRPSHLNPSTPSARPLTEVFPERSVSAPKHSPHLCPPRTALGAKSPSRAHAALDKKLSPREND